MSLSLAGGIGCAAAAAATEGASCCQVPAGTPVEVELVDQISTKSQKRGDTFAIRLAAPLVIDGRVVLREGTPGVGEVIDSTGPGIGGKPATMVLAADYLTTSAGQVPLNALKLAARGHDNSTPATVLEIGGIASLPMGVAGVVMPGGEVVFKPGSVAIARLAAGMTLPPLGRATRRDLAAAASVSALGEADADAGETAAIPIPPPPAGEGQIVFFRAKSLLGTAQWFNVRENGKALGKLGNGAYFIQPESPGVHNFTAKLEPELKDRLKIQVDPGQTYFVEGTLTAGLVLSAADLVPSTVDKFNKAAKHLKLAAAPADDKPADQAASAAPAASPSP